FFITFIFYILPFRTQNSFKYRFVKGYLVFVSLLSLGYCLSFLHQSKHRELRINAMQGFVATVIEEPIQRLKSSKLQLEIATIFYEDDTLLVQEKIVAYFATQNDVSTIHYGDVIYVNTDLQRIAAPLNPSQFDYQ